MPAQVVWVSSLEAKIKLIVQHLQIPLFWTMLTHYKYPDMGVIDGLTKGFPVIGVQSSLESSLRSRHQISYLRRHSWRKPRSSSTRKRSRRDLAQAMTLPGKS